MIRARNMDPEAGKWSEPIKLASSVTASFAFKNPTGNKILVDQIVINVTTAAANKKIYAGVASSGAATTATNELLNGQTLTSGQAVISQEPTTVAKGSYVVGTLSATDSTLDAHVFVHFKELTK